MFRPLLISSLIAGALGAPTLHAETAIESDLQSAPPAAPAAPAPVAGPSAADPASQPQVPAWVIERRAELGIAPNTAVSEQPPAAAAAAQPAVPPPSATSAEQSTAASVTAPAPQAAPTGIPDWVTQRTQPERPAAPQMPDRPDRPAAPEWAGQYERPAMSADSRAPMMPTRPKTPEWVGQRAEAQLRPERPARAALPDWVQQPARRVAPAASQAAPVDHYPGMAAPQPYFEGGAPMPAHSGWSGGSPYAGWGPQQGGWGNYGGNNWMPWGNSGWGNHGGGNNWMPWGNSGWGNHGGNSWMPWGNNGWGNHGGGNSWMPWGNSGWGNHGGNSWMPWGNNNGWGNYGGGNSWMPWDNGGWGNHGGGNNWMPWGNSGWGNNGSGWGDSWGDSRGYGWSDGSGDAAGDLDFSFALRGRADLDMRGQGSGYGAGDGDSRGFGYANQGGYLPYQAYPPVIGAAPAAVQPEQPTAPPDADNDGVADSADLCPDSVAGVSVDAFGCADEARIVLRGVNFKTDSDELTEQSLAILDGVSKTLSANPDIKVMVAGHTDSDGEDAYNKDLSQRRAQSVVDYLAGHGVDRNSMIARGFGEEQPIADNASADGKAQNRRVELNRL